MNTTASSTAEGGTAASLIPSLFPPRKPMTAEQIAAGVEAALTVQRRAVTFGKRPFAAVLVGPDNETVLLTHQSVDQVNHAESSLARLAYQHYSKDFLWTCTLFSTWEPCGMCTATIYWAHIGRIVFAGSNDQLYELTGPGNKENFTMEWHTRDFLKGCPQKDVEVIGPLETEGKVVMKESDNYWSTTRSVRK
ncbi:cytidine deaminase-like protein [Pseudomassariella vexata]|uniref:Cytidine deaminase-like protein n=1 Tax=Pseudomassariella vexata TaxID=1141098 RepID=A0A1Y2EAV6_9PEZI|nr:cytidine deaminase-like protein [Pseudomassariella vexata]ORY68699.1 cytidine deaminase-like protein [Pseudomassariella vexata]